MPGYVTESPILVCKYSYFLVSLLWITRATPLKTHSFEHL